MDRPHRRRNATSPSSAFDIPNNVRQQLVERGLNLFSPLGPVLLFAMAVCRDAGRLFYDNEVRIKVLHFHIIWVGGAGSLMRKQLDDIVGFQSAADIDA